MDTLARGSREKIIILVTLNLLFILLETSESVLCVFGIHCVFGILLSSSLKQCVLIRFTWYQNLFISSTCKMNSPANSTAIKLNKSSEIGFEYVLIKYFR